MECNRDEALRAKTISEQKLIERDYVGAKKFATKAQTLYPDLDGLSQMLTTIDVYISAENKVSGEVDWYGILGVSPSADDETVRKQYRKLALILHPDKNKAIGAEGAFKLLSEAWSVLSDKAKRLSYNQRRSSKGFQQKLPNQSGGSSGTPNANGFHNFTKRATAHSKTQNSTTQFSNSVPPPTHQRTDTFWTICHKCKMHYEYLKVYLNHTLLCPNCHEAFLASEMAPPFNFSKSVNSSSHQHQNPGNHPPAGNHSDPGRKTAAFQNVGPGGSVGVNSFNQKNHRQGMFSTTTTTGNTEPSIAAKAATVVQRANEKMRKEREEWQGGWEGNQVSGSVLKVERPLKKGRGVSDGYYYGGTQAHQTGMSVSGTANTFGLKKDGVDIPRTHGTPGIFSKLNRTRELTPFELRSMLMDKARKDIRSKLNEWRSEAARKAATVKKEKVKESKKDKGKGNVNVPQDHVSSNGQMSVRKRAEHAEVGFTRAAAVGAVKEDVNAMAMNVPDPDFHDFDLDRTESAFEDNQVWAGYDDDDGMPRFYAIIHKVISRNPFKMRISWLNSKTNSEFGPIEWVGSGFSKTCGEFRIGKYELNKSLNSFSHKVNWTKGARGTVHIFPKKGDVWAVYRNWSAAWDEQTPDEVIHKYDMVQIFNDYNEVLGVVVTPLVKVAGFRTVFCAQLEPDKVRTIPKEEMFRFSHQVPNYSLTGEEAQNAPKGYLELDPAATPVELLQVIIEANEVTKVENGGKNEDEMSVAPGTWMNKIGEDDKKTKVEDNEETKR